MLSRISLFALLGNGLFGTWIVKQAIVDASRQVQLAGLGPTTRLDGPDLMDQGN